MDGSHHGDNPLLKTNKDPNRDKILARSNNPATSETSGKKVQNGSQTSINVGKENFYRAGAVDGQ